MTLNDDRRRFSGGFRCPVCGGSDDDPRGQGRRCFGYLDSTGGYARCTREEQAGGLPRNRDDTYSHRLNGECDCGLAHGPAPPKRSGECAEHLYPSLGAVIAHYVGKGLGEHVRSYEYQDEQGDVLFTVLRFEPKGFRQARPVPGGWLLSLRGCRRLLYRLPEVLAAGERLVHGTEGEKDADRLRGLGLIATTVPGGARKWTPEYAAQLAGRQVCLYPDHDAEGEAGVAEAAALLQPLAAAVRVVRLPGLPEHGDVSDWLDQGHGLEELRQIVAATPLWSPSPGAEPESAAEADPGAVIPLRRRLAFPLAALPDTVAAFVEEAAAAMQISEGMVATLCLGCLAGAIGASRAIEVKPGWIELPMIWAAAVCEPGQGKSPTLEAVAQPLRWRESETYAAYKRELDIWQEQQREWNGLHKQERGPAPERPLWPRLLIDDITTEELGNLLSEHPRGLIQLLDEMSALVRGFDQYKAKGGGSDRSRYLKMWSASPLHIDRKGSHDKPIYVERPYLSIVGGLQPDVVEDLRDRKKNDGFLDRFLFCYEPGARPRPWSETEVSARTRGAYHHLFERLLSLEMEPGSHGLPEPLLLRKTAAGHRAWVGYYDEHEEERTDPDLQPPQLVGYYEKCKAYAARFGLVVHSVRQVEEPGLGDGIDENSVGRAWAIIDYYKAQAREVYGLLNRSALDGQVEALLAWLRRKGARRISAREACRAGVAGLRTASAAVQVFDHAQDLGWGMKVIDGGRGRQSVSLVLGRESTSERGGQG